MSITTDFSSLSKESQHFIFGENTRHFPSFEAPPREVRFFEGVKEFFYLIGSFFSFVIRNICNIFSFKSLNLEKEEDKQIVTKCDKDLCIFIPGLSASPKMWMDWKKSMDTLENLNICVIKNKNNGMQHVEDTVMPIFEAIKAFAEKHPNNKIVIIGVSLGGLSSLLIEQKLRNEGIKNPLMTVSLAGAFGTTKVNGAKRVVDVLKKIPIFGFILNLLPISLLSSFSVGNAAVENAIQYLRNDKGNTERHFISGKNDTTVYPPSNCHPIISEEDSHQSFNIRGHTSLHFDQDLIEEVKGNVEDFLQK